ncbi:hypothetical protein MASR1M36_13480 [Candidatus Cloacimonadaceae bacterium]
MAYGSRTMTKREKSGRQTIALCSAPAKKSPGLSGAKRFKNNDKFGIWNSEYTKNT